VNGSLEDRLRTGLREEATAVELPARFVATAVADVQLRRRRRQVRAVTAAIATVAVVGAGGLALGTRADDGPQPRPIDDPAPATTDAPSPPPTLDPSHVQRIRGDQTAWDALPWHETALPRALPTDVGSAPALSQDPIDHALALIGGTAASVGVVGDDGRLRRLDGVALERTLDPAGYRSSPVTQGSLAPNGGVAAFAQPDAVVVVDLTTGSSQRFDVPGHNTRVVWSPDLRQILIGREGGPSSLLGLDDGSVDAVPYDAYSSLPRW
jgi:hypothetical protein